MNITVGLHYIGQIKTCDLKIRRSLMTNLFAFQDLFKYILNYILQAVDLQILQIQILQNSEKDRILYVNMQCELLLQEPIFSRTSFPPNTWSLVAQLRLQGLHLQMSASQIPGVQAKLVVYMESDINNDGRRNGAVVYNRPNCSAL